MDGRGLAEGEGGWRRVGCRRKGGIGTGEKDRGRGVMLERKGGRGGGMVG